MSTEENKRIFMRYIEEVWNVGRMEAADEMFESNYIARRPSHPEGELDVVGPQVIKNYVQMFRSAFPDLRVTIQDMVAEGDLVVGRGIVSGTHQGNLFGYAPTGRRATWTLMGVDRFANGKIVEGWGDMDMLGALQELGVLPPPGGAQAQ
jgi:predicted ester cyclase